MKVNLTQVMVKPSLKLEEPVALNVGKELAEIIYSSSKTLEHTLFAERLYKAEGEIEVSETERQLMLSHIDTFMYWARKPLTDILEGKGE